MLKKSYQIGTLLFCTCFLFGCGQTSFSSKESTDTVVLESINIEDTKPAIELVESVPSYRQPEVTIHSGTLLSIPEEGEENGTSQAYFSGSDGVDFVAVITDITELPDEFVIGGQYEVHHSELELRSYPGQYPEVYRIITVSDIDEP